MISVLHSTTYRRLHSLIGTFQVCITHESMSNLVLKKGALDRCCGALDRLTCRAEAAILLLEEAFSFRVPLFTSSFSFPRALPSHRSAACLTKWDEPMVGTKRQKGSISMRQLRFLVTFIMALLLLVGLVELVRPGPVAHASSGTWSPTGSMSTPRSGHTATRLKNGKVLVAGGLDESDGDLASPVGPHGHPAQERQGAGRRGPWQQRRPDVGRTLRSQYRYLVEDRLHEHGT